MVFLNTISTENNRFSVIKIVWEENKMGRHGENIFKRKDGLWEARYVKGVDEFGKKKYGSVYAHSYREVKDKRQDIVSKITLIPQSVSIRRILLNQLIEEWLYLNQGRLKLSTYQKYKSYHEKHIKNEIGGYPVVYLTPVILKKFADKKQESGLSPQTVNSILTFIGGCLKYANRQYGIAQTNIIYLKTPTKEMRVLSRDEQQRLVKFLLEDTDIYKLGILVALYTGVRIGELCALQWKDIQDGTIRINKTMQRLSTGNGTEVIVGEPKTPTSNRIIPLPSFLTAEVEKFRRINENMRFLSNLTHTTIEPRVMQYHFHRYLEILDIPKANFHCLRHTFATMCVEKNFELKSLSEILGHRTINVTMNRYVHSSIELKSSNMEKLSFFL